MINLRYKEPRIYKGVTLLSYASEIDEGSLEQIINCAEFPNVKKIIITPDVHKGYTAPIGSVIITDNVLIPELLGNDIGCGISCYKLDVNINNINNSDLFLKNLYNKLCNNNILPINVRNKTTNEYLNSHINTCIEQVSWPLRDYDKDDSERLLRTVQFDKDELFKCMGTLGGGNHFIEICKDEEGELYSVVHTGSRSYGSKINKICNELCKQQKQKINDFIELTNITQLYNQNVPFSTETYDVDMDYIRDLQYISGMIKGISCFRDLKSLLFSAEQFAYYNRKLIQSIIYHIVNDTDLWQYVYGFTPDDYIDTMHNCFEIQDNKVYHFKGVSYFENAQYGIVAGSQTTGSYIVENLNKNNPIAFCSHGAGRVLSRTEARNILDFETEKEKLDQIVKYNTFKNESSLEECTSVYKDLDKVIQLQSDFIKPVKKLIPLINIKG